MSPLINLKTNFKSLKWGRDRPFGGSSNEPYIQTPIPDESPPSNIDFLLRSGALQRSAKDVSRLSQLLFDLKSPKGLLFTAKQNLLSLINVKTEASPRGLNGGPYLPSSTIAQVGVNAFGGHLNKQGLDPTGLLGAFDSDSYENAVKKNNENNGKDNRLVLLTQSKQNNLLTISSIINTSVLPGTILSYSGGPNSKVGIGQTRIRFADQRTGKNNPKIKNLGFFDGITRDIDDYSVFKRNEPELQKSKIFSIGSKIPSISGLYKKLTGIDPSGDMINLSPGSQGFYNFPISVYTPFTAGTFPEMSGRENDNNTKTFTQQQLIDEVSFNKNGELKESFVKKIIDENQITTSTILSISPSYKTKNIENRVNMGSPGIKKDILNYGLSAEEMKALDTLNALPIYESSNVNLSAESPVNDLVKFRFATLNNNSNKKVYTHFRALITSFNDAYESKLGATQYPGRGEEFYNYEGFSRKISLAFQVYAQSKAELIPMYSKLNYLATTLAPDYTGAGFMRGNITQLTLGGYLFEQPGFITSLNYEIPNESPWEIGIDQNGDFDSSVKELPLMINVTMNFQPIHTFVPRKDTNYKSNPSSKFIALTTGGKTNYSDLDSYSTYPKS